MSSRLLRLVFALLATVSCLVVLSAPAPALEPHRTRSHTARGVIPKSCYFYGVLLAGKVQVVPAGAVGRPTDRVPTFKVQVVSAFQDINVQTVSAFPSGCGKWQFVTSFPNFKIKYVNAFADFKIRFVSAFPGV